MTTVAVSQENSGNVFRQWIAGLRVARGELVWIAESDDICAPDLLEHLVHAFDDESVSIAFGDIQYCDETGFPLSGLDEYRESCDPFHDWRQPFVDTSYNLFSEAFGARNLIVNASGTLFRRPSDLTELAKLLPSFRTCGDWVLYMHLSRGGRIRYVPAAKSWFRQHGGNSSVLSQRSRDYYEEHARVAAELSRLFGVTSKTLDRNMAHVQETMDYLGATGVADLPSLYSDAIAINQVSDAPLRVLVASLGFHVGGGEIFPIVLANELRRQGHTVTFLSLDYEALEFNDGIRRRLDSDIPVLYATKHRSLKRLAVDFNIDVVSTHNVRVEFWAQQDFWDELDYPPYVVTHHGSYEVSDLQQDDLERFGVITSHWIYLTPRNLGPLERAGVDLVGKVTRLPNGMPPPAATAALSRETLAIPESAFVCAIVSRALPEKGWQIAIDAVTAVNRDSEQGCHHLVLAGDGPEYERLVETGVPDFVHLLGFVEQAGSIFEFCDVGLLPTTFAGESFPLTLIECLQSSRPVIASDVGSIPDLLTTASGEVAGMILSTAPGAPSLVEQTADAIHEISANRDRQKQLREIARECSKRYTIEEVARQYVEIFQAVCKSEQAGVVS